MTDPADYIARMRAKGLADTGVTEEVARRLYSRRGSHVMLIVEAKIEETSDTADGQHKVSLTVSQVEPANDSRLDDHLRELVRALHHERRLHDEHDQPQIDGIDDVEPTVDQVMARGRPDTLPDSDDVDDPPWEYKHGEGQDQEQEDTVPAT